MNGTQTECRSGASADLGSWLLVQIFFMRHVLQAGTLLVKESKYKGRLKNILENE